ncbi:MAG: hypothetical protein BM556_04890 [Bacteriovorax sp. MedPE-SWde]|nr:MAG: hypothetical protein BM556_04890 [Bacteriovorax sp. MedPE-SWde]
MNNKLINILFILLILLGVSCSSTVDDKYQRVDVEKYYRQSGMVKYFLVDIPDWANSSFEANCNRSTAVKYLHIDYLMKSFSLSYENAIQMQYLFNMEYAKAAKTKNGIPSLKEEESLFFLALDKIKAGQKVFKKPTFNRVNAIWIDSLLSNGGKKLRDVFNRPSLTKGRPLLISMCHTRGELISLLKKKKVVYEGSRFITYEMFSYFDKNGVRGARESLDLSKHLLEKQRKYFYYSGEKPRNINGSFKYINIK